MISFMDIQEVKKLKNPKAKGSAFERKICKLLSLWYTENERDDVFFRSASSGAMATQRFKKGKKTSGQQGDVTSTDVEGIGFINKFSIELKSYKDFSLDFLVYKNKSLIHDWWKQCTGDAERDDKTPLLIIKKNSKPEIIIFEFSLYNTFQNYFGSIGSKRYTSGYINETEVVIMLLTDFFDYVNPAYFKNEIFYEENFYNTEHSW